MQAMDSSKQSNKISDIVRLKQMLKKWRIQAHEAQANNGNTNNSSSSSNVKKGSISRSNSMKGFLKRRTLSFTDLSASNGVSNKGFPPLEDSSRANNSNHSSSSSNTKKGSLSRSNSIKGINFLKRTLSFTDLSANNGVPNTNAVPKGFLAVQVGEEMKRFVIPTKYLSHQSFMVLLKEAEEEFGYQQEGILRIPCEVEVFENILKTVEEKNSSHAKQGVRFSRNDGIVCGSSESQRLSEVHHPPSPMCR